jgi:chromosomal replication initiator protein
MTYTKNDIWDKVLNNIQTIINKQSYEMWLKGTEPIIFTNKVLKIRVADEVAQRHISDNYLPIITSLASDITGENISCVFTTETTIDDTPLQSSQESYLQSVATNTVEKSSLMLYPEYTFDNFIVGPNNQLAHAAAVSVSKAPAIQFNPLFIYGKTGLGKTHLMQAIGHKIIQDKPYMKVLYIPTEQFVNEFINAIRNNTHQSFKIKYREVDLLLIDDIQFIEKKEQTQEEFFHTFNTLHNNNKQIVITCDRPPKELTTLEERLRSRFEWGMITDIQTPNIETREAILRSKAEKLHMDITDDVLNYIARRIKSSIRALESALTRLNMVSSISNEPITINHAKQHLKDLFDEEVTKKIGISDIILKVCEKYDISPDDLKSKSRHSRVVLPRFIAMYITRNLTELTTLEIGKEFGDRDHSTVINAINNIEKSMKNDDQLHEQINEIIAELKC